MKRVAMARLRQENMVLELEKRWNTPYADCMHEFDFGFVAAIEYAMRVHRVTVNCNHQEDLLGGL